MCVKVCVVYVYKRDTSRISNSQSLISNNSARLYDVHFDLKM